MIYKSAVREMGHSLSPSSPFLPTENLRNMRRLDVSKVGFSNPFANFHISRWRRFNLFASVSETKPVSSWTTSDGNSNDDYGGWSIVEARIEKKKALPNFFLASVGTSAVIFLAAVSYHSFSKEGFRYRFLAPLQALQALFTPSETVADQIKISDHDSSGADQVSDTKSEHTTNEDSVSALGEKLERIVIPVAADSTQHGALSDLKMLKIIENDAKSDELCTRREYARWLVKANSLLERNPKHHLAPSILISGSTVSAFDDVNVRDPDFRCIQALAEAGIVSSKLSANNSSVRDADGFKPQGRVEFSPESFLSRLDLVNWKAQLEYSSVPGIEEKILRSEVGFMDVRPMSPDALPELYMDMLAGEKSIVRNVFGHCRRLQPHKPATKAQAAVALTSGRMAEAIRTELSRLEAENSSRQVEMQEIRTELLKGEIKRLWEEKLNKEKTRGLEVEKDLEAAMHDLDKEKFALEGSLAEYLKEKAGLDCRRQLLFSFKEEVDGLFEKLSSESVNFMAEQQSLGELLVDLQAKQEGFIEAKSILESEKAALRILRSWVEDEARQSQARAKVLVEAERRWKWGHSPENGDVHILQETSGLRAPPNGQN